MMAAAFALAVALAVTILCPPCPLVGAHYAAISSPITLQYKQINGVPLELDLYPVGDHLVTDVTAQCLEEIVHYCPKSYNRDPACSSCIAEHQQHITAAGCPSDLYLTQNYYCGTKPNSTVTSLKTTGEDKWLAKDTTPRPLLIYIHGGGWSHESKNEVPDYVRQLAESQKYVLASVEYRLTTQGEIFGGVESVIWPAQREDCLDAVQLLYEKANQYGIDRKRMACLGTSAGGHLCSLTALYGRRYRTTSLKIAVPLYGPTNLVNMTQDTDPAVGCRLDHDAVDSFESRLLGSELTNISVAQIRANLGNATSPWPSLVRLAWTSNPVNYVDNNAPPMFLAHGTKDGIVPYKQTQRLVDTLRLHDVRHQFVPADGCDHASEPRDCWQEAVTTAQQWITDNL